MRGGAVTIMAIAAVAVGTGGYFANEWHTCNELEAGYLNTVEGFASNLKASSMATAIGVEIDRAEQRRIRTVSLKVQEITLAHIYERCGEAAGRSASSKAEAILASTI